jgi:hypothetical protein
MTGFELLEKTFDKMLKINPYDQIIIIYQDTVKTFKSFEVLDSFYQIKKNDIGEGLAWEIMFYDKSRIIDMVVTRSSIDCSTVFAKDIVAVNLKLDYSDNLNEKNEVTHVDTMTLSIVNSNDEYSLYYTAETSKRNEFLRIRDGLLNLIPQ